MIPMLRAVPSTIRIAASRSSAFRSGIFELGDLADLLHRDLADLVPVRHAEPFASPAAFLSSTAAGGVLVMKVNVRSA